MFKRSRKPRKGRIRGAVGGSVASATDDALGAAATTTTATTATTAVPTTKAARASKGTKRSTRSRSSLSTLSFGSDASDFVTDDADQHSLSSAAASSGHDFHPKHAARKRSSSKKGKKGHKKSRKKKSRKSSRGGITPAPPPATAAAAATAEAAASYRTGTVGMYTEEGLAQLRQATKRAASTVADADHDEHNFAEQQPHAFGLASGASATLGGPSNYSSTTMDTVSSEEEDSSVGQDDEEEVHLGPEFVGLTAAALAVGRGDVDAMQATNPGELGQVVPGGSGTDAGDGTVVVEHIFVPEAHQIQAARAKRQRMRRLGTDDFVPLEAQVGIMDDPMARVDSDDAYLARVAGRMLPELEDDDEDEEAFDEHRGQRIAFGAPLSDQPKPGLDALPALGPLGRSQRRRVRRAVLGDRTTGDAGDAGVSSSVLAMNRDSDDEGDNESSEDEELRKWEMEQIRKGTFLNPDATNESHPGTNGGASPQSAPGATSARRAMRSAIDKVLGTHAMSPAQMHAAIRAALDQMRAVHERHEREAATLQQGIRGSASERQSSRDAVERAKRDFDFFQRFRDYVLDLCDCWEVKEPVIRSAEQHLTRLWSTRNASACRRHAGDVRDLVGDALEALEGQRPDTSDADLRDETARMQGESVGSEPSDAASGEPGDAPTTPPAVDEFGRDTRKLARMAAVRRATKRRTRARKRAEARRAAVEAAKSEGEGMECNALEAHQEGWSTDDDSDEIVNVVVASISSSKGNDGDRSEPVWRRQHEAVVRPVFEAMDEVVDDFASLPSVLQRFADARREHAKAYSEAYVSGSLVQVLEPMVRWEMLSWHGVWDEMRLTQLPWYARLRDFVDGSPKPVGADGAQVRSSDDETSEASLLADMVALVVVPKVVSQALEAGCYLHSGRRTRAAVCVVEEACFALQGLRAYDSKKPLAAKPVAQLWDAVMEGVRAGLDCIRFPMPTSAVNPRDPASPAYALACKRLVWMALKRIHNACLWAKARYGDAAAGASVQPVESMDTGAPALLPDELQQQLAHVVVHDVVVNRLLPFLGSPAQTPHESFVCSVLERIVEWLPATWLAGEIGGTVQPLVQFMVSWANTPHRTASYRARVVPLLRQCGHNKAAATLQQ